MSKGISQLHPICRHLWKHGGLVNPPT